jgi:HAD superfamily hydrolase (TIGR01509 family)
MPLSARDCWIFDMDGTLTVAAHDFDGIRAELGLPEGKPILEAIARLPRLEAQAVKRKLGEIEHEIALVSRPQPGASDVLEALFRWGARLGIVTRNSEPIARTTLIASGLSEFFFPADIVGRESSPPKPLPDGIYELLGRWDATPERAVMIGDSHQDLEAGRSAGTATVHFDVDGVGQWDAVADHRVEELPGLLALFERRQEPDPRRSPG